jgi:hypothetical protein
MLMSENWRFSIASSVCGGLLLCGFDVGSQLQEDEDDDLRAMESRSRMLNRADFETDEQFQAYKSSKEAAPKAAFQFGVKVRYIHSRFGA